MSQLDFFDRLRRGSVREVRSVRSESIETKTDRSGSIEGSTGCGPFDDQTDPFSASTITNGYDTEKKQSPPHPPVGEERTDLGGESEVRSGLGSVRSAEPSLGAGPRTDPPDQTSGSGGDVGGTGEPRQGETAPPKNEPPVSFADLRPYQLDAYLGVLEVWRHERSALVVMPTGTGKTRVIGAIAKREHERGGKALVIAHREELLEQLAGELARAAVIRDATAIGVLEKAEQRGSLSSPAVVASIQSLTAKRTARYPAEHFSLIVVDEAHHATSTSYQRVLEYFCGARVLGVTATPDRADGKPLGDAFGRVAFTYEIRRAIADGWLVPPVVRRITVRGLDLSSLKSHHGDFDRGQLSSILAAEQMLHGVAKPLVDEAGDRKTIVFAVDVAHAHALAEVINRYRPGLAMALDGSATLEQRRAVLSLFRRGEIQFLVNCQLLTEGFDEQAIACVAMARPTQSRGFYVQCLGRGFRVLGASYAESVANGKRDCLVLDFVGASKHPLRGPADALAGNLDAQTRAAVERILDGGETDIEAALAKAEELAAREREKAEVKAIVEYRTRDVDPFLGDQVRVSANWSTAPATDAQRAALEKIGLARPPASLTEGEADAILEANQRARDKGLATIPQQRVLHKLKLDTRGMTSRRANELINKAYAKGFYPYVFLDEPEAKRSAQAIHLDPKDRRW